VKPRKADRHLPACVYHRHGAYYYVKAGEWRRLGADLQTALAEYARIIAMPDESMAKLIDRAMPTIIENKAPATVTQYLYAARLLSEGFAEFAPHDVRTSDVVKMLDAYRDSPATAQRLLGVLKAVFAWACERDIVPVNPCVAARRPPPLRRDRLIARGEYDAIYAQASPRLQTIMDLCRLTGQRIGDVLSIQRAQLEDGGIRFRQQKTGTELVVAWTPELRAVVERAKSLAGPVAGLTLYATRGGKALNHANTWREFKLAAARAGVENVRPHDLRALAATEAHAQGLDATALLGHKSARTTEIYLRDKTPKTVTPPTYAGAKKARRKT
jgi:integrase